MLICVYCVATSEVHFMTRKISSSSGAGDYGSPYTSYHTVGADTIRKTFPKNETIPVLRTLPAASTREEGSEYIHNYIYPVFKIVIDENKLRYDENNDEFISASDVAYILSAYYSHDKDICDLHFPSKNPYSIPSYFAKEWTASSLRELKSNLGLYLQRWIKHHEDRARTLKSKLAKISFDPDHPELSARTAFSLLNTEIKDVLKIPDLNVQGSYLGALLSGLDLFTEKQIQPLLDEDSLAKLHYHQEMLRTIAMIATFSSKYGFFSDTFGTHRKKARELVEFVLRRGSEEILARVQKQFESIVTKNDDIEYALGLRTIRLPPVPTLNRGHTR